jgi:tetratricopeptide (TPR) repeat protein
MRGTVVAVLLAVALDAAAHGKAHDQIARASARIAADPKNAALYLERGELHRLHREFDEASRDYERAAALDPRLEALDLARGLLLAGSGKPFEALAPLRRYLALRPGDLRARIATGRAYAAIGEHEAATAELAAALDASPAVDPDLLLELTASLTAAGRSEEALRRLDLAMQTLGLLPTLQTAAVDLEVAQGRIDAALRRIDRAAAAAPRKESWLARRGDLLVAAGRSAEAREAYQAALASIETVPAARRRTRGMAALEAHILGALRTLK